MFSRILTKLVDEAIVPAIILLVARVVSVVFFGRYFNLHVSIGTAGFVYADAEGFLIVNSYSTLTMVCVIAVGLLYVLIKSYIFHDSHIRPSLTAKLFTLRLSSFIQASFDVYSQGVIWLSYSYLLLLASGVMLYFGLVYAWIFYVSLILTVISTYLLIIDVEKEFKPNKDTIMDKVEEVVLTWEDLE